MKLRSTAIALGVGAATAAGLSLLKVDKPVVIGSTAVVVAGGLMIAKKDGEEFSADENYLYCQSSIKGLTEEIKKNPSIEGNYIRRGLFKQRFDPKGAIQDYTKVLELNPKSAHVYFYRAWTRRIIGDTLGAIEDLRVAKEIDPENTLIKEFYEFRQLTNYLLKEQFERLITADDALGNILRMEPSITPKNANEYNLRGISKAEINDFKGAINDYTIAIQMCPSDPFLYSNRGISYDNYGDPNSAINDFTKAIELNPKLGRSYYDRGVTLRDSGNEQDAINDFTKSIELDPEESASYLNRGIIRFNSSDLKGAYEDLKKAAALGDKNAIGFIKDNFSELESEKDINLNQKEEEVKEFPVSIDAFNISIEVNTLEIKWVKERNMSDGTFILLHQILTFTDPQFFCDDIEEFYENNLVWIKNETTDINRLKEWVDLQLNNSEYDEEMDSDWDIGSNDSCKYRDKGSFLSDIDWGMVVYIITKSWNDCLSEEAMSRIKKIKKRIDNFESQKIMDD